MDTIKRKIAEILLNTNAVKLSPAEPFTWSSGWKSPIYCDNRVTLSYPKERSFIAQSLANHVREHYPEVEVIAGVATAGIAQGALVANLLELPYIYVRPEPKKHGMKNCVEGHLKAGQKVVLIEDLISTGGSSVKAAKNVENEGGNPIAIVGVFSYGFDVADKTAQDNNIKFSVLSDYNELMSLALDRNIISQTQLESLKQWREKPESWGV